jgi:alpha-D-xyloside xylohydrolase
MTEKDEAMRAKALETGKVVRAVVEEATVLQLGRRSVLLRTVASVAVKGAISSADAEAFGQHAKHRIGDRVEGRLRLDVEADHVVRIRYAEGDGVPENATPMVVGRFSGPSRCRIARAAGAVTVTTPALTITLTLKPFRIEIRDAAGEPVCGIGGREKNNFQTWDSFNTGVCRTLSDRMPLAVENFDLAPDECIYGLGEQFIKLNKVGQTIVLNTTDALGVLGARSYKNIPFFVSNRGYGVFFNHSSLMTFWVGSRTATDLQVAADEDFLDYYVMTGPIKRVLASYTRLTGQGVVPPRWTFGFWQSKFTYRSAKEVLGVIRQMRRHRLPCDVIHLDPAWYKTEWLCDLEFDPVRFANPKAFLAKLKRLGVRVSLWQLPYIPEGSRLFDELKAVGGFVKNPDGSIYDIKTCFAKGFTGVVGVVDYTNPAAIRVQGKFYRCLFRLGAGIIKTDFGEDAPLSGIYHDGTPGHRAHNLYPLLYNRAVFNLMKRETGEGVVWTRGAWAGSQRYPIHWGGDNSPNYANLAPQLNGGLSLGLSGFQFWSQDIGGFCGDTNDRLLTRWLQWGVFLSHTRVHGTGTREIYSFKPRTLRICRDFLHLRFRLLPYIIGSARRCVAESLPMARALVIEYQDDPNVWNLGDEYLFGDSLLIAPLLTEGNRRRVYLPQGEWTDWWTRKRLTGGGWIETNSSLETIPVFIREGALIPMGPVQNYVDEVKTTEIELLVSRFAGDGRNRFVIPLDGKTVAVDYRARNGRHVVRIGPTAGRFKVVTLGGPPVTVERS